VVGKTYRRGLARESALILARKEALSYLKGLRLEGGMRLGDLYIKDSNLRELADNIVSHSEEILCEFSADNGAVVVIQIERAKIDEILEKDRYYEGKQEKQNIFLLPRTPKNEGDGSYYRPISYPKGKNPSNAVLLGLILPGGSHYYNGETTKGLLYTAGVLTLCGVGGSMISQKKPEGSEGYASGNQAKNESTNNDNKTAGTIVLVLAGLLHLTGCITGAMDTYSKNFEIEQMDRENGVRVRGTYKWE
jgi:hypothetical protein